MKNVLLALSIVITIVMSSCSKKSNPAPEQDHAIKIIASGTAAFSVIVLTAPTFGETQTALKSATIAAGETFEFSTTAASKSYFFVKLSSELTNNITYKIYDDGTLSDQENGKEFGTHSTATVQYMVK